MSPFTPQEIDQLKAARSQWNAALNLFGAALLALTLPYYDALRKGEWTVLALISLLLSLYVAVMALTRDFPDALQRVKEHGSEEKKKFVKKEIMTIRSIFGAWLYCIAWISLVIALFWTVELMGKIKH